jgi:cation diffusion facilitator family transporter
MSFFLSKKLQGDDSFKYDYGMGKIEAFGSFASAMLMSIGLIIVLATSIYALLNPSAPGELLILAVFLKIINVIVGIFLLYKQVQTSKKSSSGFVKANLISMKINLIFDSVAMLAVTAAFLLRSHPYTVYLEPIICIICAIYLFFDTFRIIKNSSTDLLDKTLDEDSQMKILKGVSKIWDDIEGFNGIRTRRSGSIIYIDLMVTFGDEKSYSDVNKAYEIFDKAIKEIMPDSVTAIIIGGEKEKISEPD